MRHQLVKLCFSSFAPRDGSSRGLALHSAWRRLSLLGGGIEIHRVVHTVVGAKGQFLIATVDAVTAGIN